MKGKPKKSLFDELAKDDPLEKIAPLVGENRDLRELSLIATAVTGDGMERLKVIFPKAAITVHSWEDEKRDPSLGDVRDM